MGGGLSTMVSALLPMTGMPPAYIGPGSGLALSLSLLTVIFVVLGVLALLVCTPLLALRSLMRRRRPSGKNVARKLVVLGLDGLDPRVVRDLMEQGRLPNMEALARKGCFTELATTTPAISPTAWSSFMVGADASWHGVYDFVGWDPDSCLPRLSSHDIGQPDRRWKIGPYSIPLSKSPVRLLRKGTPFWHTLACSGLEVTVLRVPITFPPEPFKGRLLSGMCVPDLMGTQGTYTCFGTANRRTENLKGIYRAIRFENGVARTHIVGPRHPWLAEDRNLSTPLQISKTDEPDTVRLRLKECCLDLRLGEYSDWVSLSFRAGPVRIRGEVRFCLVSCSPETEIYMTPINISPARPVMKISHPRFFSDYLADQMGLFSTLGMVEDTTAFNDGVLTEDAFLKQVWLAYEERKRMFFNTLDRGLDDVVICVFDTPDRMQHMFGGSRAEKTPGADAKHEGGWGRRVEETYVEMDKLVGQTVQRLPKGASLIVMSDHGFANFTRSVNLNTWLCRNGYLRLLPDGKSGEEWLQSVDWSRTRAFALGLAGVYINLRGRGPNGIVDPERERDILLSELRFALQSIVDAKTGSRVIRRVVITRDDFSGPFRDDGPDLIICYEDGYRCSREGGRGQVTEAVICDNTDQWGADHCVDPELVPGVLFADIPMKTKGARMIDVAPTILDVLGVAAEAPMQGVSLLLEKSRRGGK